MTIGKVNVDRSYVRVTREQVTVARSYVIMTIGKQSVDKSYVRTSIEKVTVHKCYVRTTIEKSNRRQAIRSKHEKNVSVDISYFIKTTGEVAVDRHTSE